MSSIRERVIVAAQSFVGLDANPADADSRRRYLDVIAPGETASVSAEMAQMSGCGLVVAGIWRAAGVSDARLSPPYHIGTAISRLVRIARAVGAWVPFAEASFPEPGDMVLVGDDGSGGPEHVFTVTSIAFAEGGVRIESVDGGQRDDRKFETILVKDRVWEGQKDTVPGRPSRLIVGWINVELLPVTIVQPRATAGSSEANVSLLTVTAPLDAPGSLQQITPTSGAPGADSSAAVTHSISGRTLVEHATQDFGKAPVFWGRYFAAVAAGRGQYNPEEENDALRVAGIRVLPIARQTTRVNGSLQDGESDGSADVTGFIAAFGLQYLVSQGGEFLLFLDVEGSPHSLSADYYVGWCRGLESAAPGLKIHPCVYATQDDGDTWAHLKAAMDAGATCRGLWVAHWQNSPGFHPITAWSPIETTPMPAVSVPVLLWQYANDVLGNGGFDCSQVNPALDLEQDLLRYLVLPPG